jgi:O-antigen/teichoic acid export membrane protein
MTLALIVWAATSAVFLILPLPPLLKTVFLIYMGNLLFEGLYLDWYYRGIAAFKKISTARVITALLYTGSVAFLLQRESSLVGVALLFLFWNLLQAILLLVQSKPFRIRLARFSTLKEVLRHAFPVGGGTLLQHLPLLLPPLLLTYFHSAEESAEYGAAFRIIMLIKILDPVVSNLYLSSFPKIWNSNPELAIRQVNRVVLGITVLFTMIILLLSPLSSFITSLIYGEKYGTEPLLLPLFGFFIFGTILNTIISLGIIAITDNRRYFHVSIIATLVNLPLMFILIIPFGTVGAASALVIAEWSITLFSYRVFKEFVPLRLTPLFFFIVLTVLGTILMN